MRTTLYSGMQCSFTGMTMHTALTDIWCYLFSHPAWYVGENSNHWQCWEDFQCNGVEGMCQKESIPHHERPGVH